jgi:DNA end-binding protein Ku
VFTITFCKRPLADAREVVVVQLQLLDLMIPKLAADDINPEVDQSRAATRIALRPHDPETGEEIDKREIVKGYEYGRGQFVTLTPEELKALDIDSSKVIDLEKFVPRSDLC